MHLSYIFFIDIHDLWARSRVLYKGQIFFKSIYLKSIHSGNNFKATNSHDMCYLFGLYFASSCMCRFSNDFKGGSILEYVGIVSIQDSLDWFESQMDSNTIFYFELKTWNMALQPAYNICKLSIQTLWCSNFRPYKNL